MAKVRSLTGDNNVSVFDTLDDELDIVIAVSGNMDFSGESDYDLVDHPDPLREALDMIDEKGNFTDGGDHSLKVNIQQDFEGVSQDPTQLDQDASDLIATCRDLAFDNGFDDDDIINAVMDTQ